MVHRPNTVNEIKISVGGQSDSADYCQLMKECFVGDWYEARFDWQYFSADHSTIFIARHGQESVGILGIERRHLNTGEPCVVVIDIAVAKAWRRRGVLRQLESAATTASQDIGAAVMMSFPNDSGAVALGHLRDWKILTPIPELRRVIANEMPADPIFSHVKCQPSTFTTLRRDDEYRSWRYNRHPLYKYHLIKASGGVGGVIKAFGEKQTIGDVLEVFGDISNMENLEIIYRAINEKFVELNAVESMTWGALPPFEIDLLTRLGWEQRTQRRNLAVKSLNSASRKLCDYSKWRLQPVDIEHY